MKSSFPSRDKITYGAPRLPSETIPNPASEINRTEANLELSNLEEAEHIAPQRARDGRSAALLLPIYLVAALGLVALGAWTNRRNAQPPLIGPIANRVLEAKPVIVHVAGAVKKPGVYTLKSGARLFDALQKAGGATSNADANALNLAALAQDGSKIVVPTKPQTPTQTPTQLAQNPAVIEDLSLATNELNAEKPNDSSAETPKLDAELPFASASAAAKLPAKNQIKPATSSTRSVEKRAEKLQKPAIKKPRAKKEKSKTIAGLPRALTPSGELSNNASPDFLKKHPLDLNRITQEQLEALPGVGPSLAERVLVYRKANGGFKSVDELDNVKGIGEKKLAALLPLLRVEGEVQAAPKSDAATSPTSATNNP